MLHDAPPPAAPAKEQSRAHPDATGCHSYGPGHLMHYRHQGLALRSPCVAATSVLVDDTSVRVALEDGEVLHWRHHDPERLRRMLELVLGPRMVYREHHALRVGPYWFNCAPSPDAWADCRSD